MRTLRMRTWQVVFLLVIFISGCEVARKGSGPLEIAWKEKHDPATSLTSGKSESVKAANLLGMISNFEQDMRLVPIKNDEVIIPKLYKDQFFIVEERVVLAVKKGSVVAVLFLREKLSGIPIAVQVEVDAHFWPDYSNCGTAYFADGTIR